MLLPGLAALFSSGAVVTLLVTQDVRGAAFPASEYGTECSVTAVSETDGCTCYGGPLCGTQPPGGIGQFALRHAPQVSDQAQGGLQPRPASAIPAFFSTQVVLTGAKLSLQPASST